PPEAFAPARPRSMTLTDRNVAMGSDPFGEPVSGSSPRLGAADLMRSGSHDATVQFSLDDIRALSAVAAPGKSAPPPTPSKTGFAADDDSGLIDVRSLTEQASDEQAFRPIELTASPLDTLAPVALQSG